MSFPTTIDSFSIKNTGDTIQESHVNDLQTAIVALETKVGANSSAVATSIDYLLTNTSSSNPGHKHTTSSLSDFTITSASVGDIIQYNGTKFVNVTPTSLALKFGGIGSDGALNITSGTTTIDCGNAAVLIKNYTSISITGSGTLAFSNPHANGTTIILKSQGAVTLTSSSTPMIAANAMGAAGAVANTIGGSDGTPGTAGISLSFVTNGGGLGGQNAVDGAGGAINSLAYQSVNTKLNTGKYSMAFVGAGGGSGRCANANPGAGGGGRGGGCLIIECGGALNFTTTGGLSTGGGVGGAGTGTSNGGGGGGGGGFLGLFYNILTSLTGTVTVTGGAGGAGTGTHGGGGGGAITAGLTGGGPTGGAGAAGLSLIVQNTEYA